MTGVAKRVDRFQWLKIPNVMYRMRWFIAVFVLTIVAWPGAIAGEGTWERIYDFSGKATVKIKVDLLLKSDRSTVTRDGRYDIDYQVTGYGGVTSI